MEYETKHPKLNETYYQVEILTPRGETGQVEIPEWKIAFNNHGNFSHFIMRPDIGKEEEIIDIQRVISNRTFHEKALIDEIWFEVK